jgi:hypothetical protein
MVPMPLWLLRVPDQIELIRVLDNFFEGFAGSAVGVILDPIVSEDGNAELLRGSRVCPIQLVNELQGSEENQSPPHREACERQNLPG